MISWCWLPPIGAFNGILDIGTRPYEGLLKIQEVAPLEEINTNQCGGMHLPDRRMIILLFFLSILGVIIATL